MHYILSLSFAVLATAALTAGSAAGIRWTPPPGWTAEAPRPMRAATYSIAPAAGDSMPAECVVNFFGPGQGGSVEANVERWKAQVQGADGKPAPAKVDKRTVRGVPVTMVDASGTYTGMGGPMMASPKALPNFRLVGAIVEAPGGSVFFKLTGPAKTIAAQQKPFEQLLASIQPE